MGIESTQSACFNMIDFPHNQVTIRIHLLRIDFSCLTPVPIAYVTFVIAVLYPHVIVIASVFFHKTAINGTPITVPIGQISEAFGRNSSMI